VNERIDYDRLSATYDAGRAFPQDWLQGWREAADPYLSELKGAVLDLGSGTGIWSLLLAEWFDVEVIGVEPSSGMRAEALRKRSHPRVKYVGGRAEDLPLTDGVCAATWISTVVHYFTNAQVAAREVRRVMKPNGPVLIRSAFSGRHDGVPWMRFFPSARALADRRHPRLEATLDAFSAGGFGMESLTPVSQVTASNLDEYGRRVATRTDSTLALISDEEFERGLADLRRAARDAPPAPVRTTLDLLVLR
jgi:ubiquinone/menaquinone biosynthesis C-methylase UbiE